jgi:hypothetical protein
MRLQHAVFVSTTAVSTFCACCVQGSTIVVPNASATVEGDANNDAPFGSYAFRYQQVYSATEFPFEPIYITAISFRLDDRYGAAFTTTIPDIRINLSTTPACPEFVPLTFADNVGADDTIVHSGPLSLSSSFSSPSPKAFDITIPIPQFWYNPRHGNLLLDIRKSETGGEGVPPLDAVAKTLDAISRVTAGDVHAAVANNRDTLGLVTQFTYMPVPEPPAWVLALLTASVYLQRRGRNSQ